MSARSLHRRLHTPFHHARSIADFSYAEKLTVSFSVQAVINELLLDDNQPENAWKNRRKLNHYVLQGAEIGRGMSGKGMKRILSVNDPGKILSERKIRHGPTRSHFSLSRAGVYAGPNRRDSPAACRMAGEFLVGAGKPSFHHHFADRREIQTDARTFVYILQRVYMRPFQWRVSKPFRGFIGIPPRFCDSHNGHWAFRVLVSHEKKIEKDCRRERKGCNRKFADSRASRSVKSSYAPFPGRQNCSGDVPGSPHPHVPVYRVTDLSIFRWPGSRN